ncbi:hypothetical protein TNCV_2601791 [Trichonephila clavipes]|nr:hypothetical protein TNCV_2601791 [Trichonephila clavipes]
MEGTADKQDIMRIVMRACSGIRRILGGGIQRWDSHLCVVHYTAQQTRIMILDAVFKDCRVVLVALRNTLTSRQFVDNK